jgi:hypothetical protein
MSRDWAFELSMRHCTTMGKLAAGGTGTACRPPALSFRASSKFDFFVSFLGISSFAYSTASAVLILYSTVQICLEIESWIAHSMGARGRIKG